MSDTPRTDAFLISSDGMFDLPETDHIVSFCRAMERENNGLRAKLAEAEKDAVRKGELLVMAKGKMQGYMRAGWLVGAHHEEARFLIGYIDAAMKEQA